MFLRQQSPVVPRLLHQSPSGFRCQPLVQRRQGVVLDWPPRLQVLPGCPRTLMSGTTLFQRICELDLEGIVAKHKLGPYVADRESSTWVKILNRRYSQKQGCEDNGSEGIRHQGSTRQRPLEGCKPPHQLLHSP
jgi:hypothetical protein